MSFTILNPSFIDDGAGGFTSWSVGANVAWTPEDLAPDNHGATGVYLSAGTGTDNQVYQAGVFSDFDTPTIHRITVVVNQYAGGDGVKVRFGTNIVGTITAAGTFNYSGLAIGDGTLSLEIMAGTTIEINNVAVADVIRVGGPQELSPAYNPSVWYFDSVNKGQPGYRYFVKVKKGATVIAQSRYVPAPATGYAVVDLTRILKNFVSYPDVPTIPAIALTPNSYLEYTIEVYDEYSVPYVYDDFTNPSGDLTSLTAITNTHNYNVGDLITVSQTDSGTLNPSIQGVHTVIAPTVAGTSELYIDVPWHILASGSVGGSVIYADNRKTLSAVQYTSGVHVVFNGAVPFLDFPAWDANEYQMDEISVLTKFLTSMPRTGFYIYDTQDIVLNYAEWYNNGLIVYFENDGGDKFSCTSAITTEPVLAVSAGPNTTMTATVSGTAPLVKPDTLYYDVWTALDSGQHSEKIRFYIDRRCRIEDYEILFLDRMGSELSFAFELRTQVTNNNEKSTFKKLAGGLSTDVAGDAYNYNTYDRGEETYNVNFDQTQQLSTNWMDDAASVYFQELVTSPLTYLKVAPDTYRSVIVTNKTMEEKRQRNKRLIKYTIDVRFSNNDTINI